MTNVPAHGRRAIGAAVARAPAAPARLTRATATRALAAALLALAATGCAGPAPLRDNSAFIQARPVTLLVLPPLNQSTDIAASPAVWAQTTRPLAEAGYYVIPAAIVDRTLRENGVQTPGDAHQIAPAKLREVFGADAAVYIDVLDYGTKFLLVDSTTKVSLSARIVDLRTGQTLWTGAAASQNSASSPAKNGVAGLLVAALVRQVSDSVGERAYEMAGIADARLLATQSSLAPNGLPRGPRALDPGQSGQTGR